VLPLVLIAASLCTVELRTAGQKISVDSEGGANAGADKNKYLAPLALGVLAAASMGGDEESDVFKNGEPRVRSSRSCFHNGSVQQECCGGFYVLRLIAIHLQTTDYQRARGLFRKGHAP
jgi:hypothetical protein